MNTKLLMSASSMFMGLIGIMPYEVLETFKQAPNETLALTLQLAGAIYLGFALTNWMAKTVLIGGIYSKPLSIGNFSHFFIAALALVKGVLASNTGSVLIITLTILYVLFAALFGYVLFTHPIKHRSDQI